MGLAEGSPRTSGPGKTLPTTTPLEEIAAASLFRLPGSAPRSTIVAGPPLALEWCGRSINRLVASSRSTVSPTRTLLVRVLKVAYSRRPRAVAPRAAEAGRWVSQERIGVPFVCYVNWWVASAVKQPGHRLNSG